jgi:hypothetical protein
MAIPRLTHDQRELQILTDLESHFQEFAGYPLSWSKVPDGQDPPDFIARAPRGAIGLELIEWLDGKQMGPAKGRESQREGIRRVLSENWTAEYQPENYGLAVVMPDWNLRIARSDEVQLRQEFLCCAENVDRTWLTNPERIGDTHYQADLSLYPLVKKYFHGIRYIGGGRHGFCWIDVEEGGGAYDPTATVLTLEQALDKKLTLYSTSEKQAHLRAHGLAELSLLVHGGINAYRYNTPGGPLSLEQIAERGAAFYAAHPQRHIFNRVWFFDSLNSADDLNALLGYPPGYGGVRWLAQLWPTFDVDPRSSLGSRELPRRRTLS